MGKLTSNLKHFFYLDNSASYDAVRYRDYTGPGFKSFKKSEYFSQRLGLSRKAEVAAWSEMTKVSLLILALIIAGSVLFFDIELIKVLADASLRTKEVALYIIIPVIIANLVFLSEYPRLVFLIKNFEVRK